MAENSKIEWTDHTFNPWTGCAKVSPGCAHCYAEGWAKRSGIVQWGPGKPRRRTSVAKWREPLKWNATQFAECMACRCRREFKPGLCECCDGNQFRPVRPRVFCASLADWLDDEAPIEWLADLLLLIHQTPNLDWLLLSKRPQNFQDRIKGVLQTGVYSEHTDGWLSEWRHGSKLPANVWIGTTVEDQTRADERIPELLKIPARVRFLSCEPLLGPVDLQLEADPPRNTGLPRCRVDWVIAGGESGPGDRPMHPDWARSLRDQCQAAGVPYFMKQMGGIRKPFPAIPEDLNVKQWP